MFSILASTRSDPHTSSRVSFIELGPQAGRNWQEVGGGEYVMYYNDSSPKILPLWFTLLPHPMIRAATTKKGGPNHSNLLNVEKFTKSRHIYASQGSSNSYDSSNAIISRRKAECSLVRAKPTYIPILLGLLVGYGYME